MFEIFNSLQSLVKLESVCIDNNVFRVHYKATVVLLLACSVLIVSNQYFGSPINCTFDAPIEHVIDNFCWIHSYITVPKNREVYEREYGKIDRAGIIQKSDNTMDIFQMHYQWIGVILFIQAVFFFIPRFIWKYNLEDGKIKSLAKDITSLFPNPDKQIMKIKMAVNYLRGSLGQNNVYFFQFFFCEMLNLLNVLIQIHLTDRFLGNAFTTHGFGIFAISNEFPTTRNDKLNFIFPKVVKCDFNRAGHAGGAQDFHAVCVLPANVFNEKVYIFLWFWFIGVAIISILGLIYRLITIFWPQARAYILHRKFAIVNEEEFELVAQPGQVSEITEDEALDIITDRFNVGDWFMLYQVGKNMDSLVFGNLVREFVLRLKQESYKLDKRNNHNLKIARQDSLKGVDVSRPLM